MSVNNKKKNGPVTGSILTVRRNFTLWERTSYVFAIVMLALFPLLINKDKYADITAAKFYYFVGITSVYLVVSVVIGVSMAMIDRNRQLRKGEGRQKLSITQIVLTGYVAWACISALVSDYGKDCLMGQSRFEGLISIILYAACFMLLSLWGEYSDHYFYAMSVMAIIVGLIGFGQSFGSSWLYPEGCSYWNTHFLSTIGNIDCVSGIIATVVPVLFCSFVLLEGRLRYIFLPGIFLLFYLQIFCDVDGGKIGLLLAVFVALPFLIDEKWKISRTLYASSAVLAAYGLAKGLTYTENEADPALVNISFTFGAKALCGIALAVICTVLAFFMSKTGGLSVSSNGTKDGGSKTEPVKIRRIVWIVMGAMIIVGFVFTFYYKGENVMLHDISEALHGRMAEDAGSGRGHSWKIAWAIMLAHPVFGGGPGTFISLYNEATNNTVPLGVLFDFAHNDFLQNGACVGVVGMLIYIAFVVLIAVRALKNAHRFPPIVILGAGIAGYLVYSFFTFSIAIVTPLFWVMAGILDKTIRQLPDEKTEKKKAQEQS